MDARVKIDFVIKQLEENVSRWDEYVVSHDEGTFFHLSGWRETITQAFGHKCFYLYAQRDDQVCGILPLVEVKSALFGHALVSTPFCVYGGAIADSDLIKRKLEEAACSLAEQIKVDYLELRYKREQDNGMLLKQAHATFGYDIANKDSEAILSGIKKKQRAVIRHSLKNELTADVTSKIDEFYDILSVSYRNLGTPIFSKRYFKALMTTFSDSADIYLIKDASDDISSAVMNFYFKDQVLPYYGGGTAAARALKSADFMYYQVMCDSAERGAKWFDFGRSKNDSGPYKYKKNWGMEPQPLYYYYHLVKAESLPNLSPNNPKYKMFISLWQKLPLRLSQFLGPFLSKYLG